MNTKTKNIDSARSQKVTKSQPNMIICSRKTKMYAEEKKRHKWKTQPTKNERSEGFKEFQEMAVICLPGAVFFWTHGFSHSKTSHDTKQNNT